MRALQKVNHKYKLQMISIKKKLRIHLDPMNRKERRLIMRELGKCQKQIRKMPFICLFPGCKDMAIKSHSQQKEGQLRSIARGGIVYAFGRNYYRSVKPEHIGKLELIPTGITQASTFSGFCGYHDKELFTNLESQPLVGNDPIQAVLFFLRAISFEYAQKRKGAIFLKRFIEVTQGIIEPDLTKATTFLKEGMQHFLDFDGPFYLKAAFDTLGKNLDQLMTEWVIAPKNLMASCCCCLSPLRDNHIDYKIMHPDEPGPLVTFNLVPEHNQTHIIISWLKQDSKPTAWIRESVADAASLERLINECAIAESEDTCFSPNLWENTPHDVQLDVLNAMRKVEFRGPLEKYPLVVKI